MTTPQRFLSDFRANSVLDLVDEDGRPLGEVASQITADGTVAACPFAGSRHGRPMNRSAMQGILACWPRILDQITAWGGDGTVHGAWCTTIAAISQPLLVAQPVSRLVAASYKTLLGFSQALTLVMLQQPGIAAEHLTVLGNGQDFHAWVEAEGLLVGNEQVCAGLPAQIAAVFDRLAEPHPSRTDWHRAYDSAAIYAAILVELALDQQFAFLGPRPLALTHAASRCPDGLPMGALALFPAGRAPTAIDQWRTVSGDTVGERLDMMERILTKQHEAAS